MPRGDATQKARQRARNGTASGSSGITSRATRLGRIDIDSIGDKLEPVADVIGLVESGRIYANGAIAMTVQTSPEWGHDLLDITHAARGRALVLRAFVVPIGVVLDEDEDDA